MTDIVRNDRSEDGSGSQVSPASRGKRLGASGADGAEAGESEEELFGDPFERPRESAR